MLSVLGTYAYFKPELPSVEMLKDVELQTPMRIYSSDGKLISQYGVKRRIPVDFDEIPETLIQALIATEDSRFYQHMGLDPIGVMRASLNLAVTGELQQGASTITMQLARGFFLTRDKTFVRKIKEIFIAWHIEQVLTKNEILALYVNKVALGHRSFGFGAAAQVYYGKPLAELNLAQLATLAGLPKAPSALNPISNPKRSKDRRRIVLLRMLDEGFINQQQYELAADMPVVAKLHGAEIELDAPYLASMVYQEMVSIYGKEIAETSGFKVYATASSALQGRAQFAVRQNLYDYDERHGFRGPIGRSRQVTTTTNNRPAQTPTDATVEWQYEPLMEELQGYQTSADLLPAAVTSLGEQSMQVFAADGQQRTIDWAGMHWARPFIDDARQGPIPQRAADIVSLGDIIYVRQNQKGNWQIAQLPEVAGAFVALNPMNGAIQAIVGGFDYYTSPFNRATQAKRQVGSNIKPFIYAAALDSGMSVASLINDAPINQWDASSGLAWRPQNSPAVYDGPLRMRVALGRSKNVVSVRLLRSVGLRQTAAYLTRFGFDKDAIPLDETLSLGSSSHTPLEVVRGFAAFANGGFLVTPYVIERITDATGNVLWQAQPAQACDPCDVDLDPVASEDQEAALAKLLGTEPKDNPLESPRHSAPRIIDEQVSFLIRDMMRTAAQGNGRYKTDSYWIGTGWRARNILGRSDIGGKTGTTNDAKDTWFSGFAPNLVATSWVGFDDPSRELGRASRNQHLINLNPRRFNYIGNALIGAEDGAKAAQPAWIRFMRTYLETPEGQPLDSRIPAGLVSVRIDRETGLRSTKTDQSSMFEWFRYDNQPDEYVNRTDFSLSELESKTRDEQDSNLQTDDIF